MHMQLENCRAFLTAPACGIQLPHHRNHLQFLKAYRLKRPHLLAISPPVKPVSAMSSQNGAESLVAPEWLHERLQDPHVKIVDGSWYMPNSGRNPAEEFRNERIPGSKFFDMDKVADTSSDLPHMLPPDGVFAAAMDSLGISKDDTVVVYDRAGIFSAPRVWWTFRVFGHERVAVLDGGYPTWKAAGFEIDRTLQSQAEVDTCANAASSSSSNLSYTPQLQNGMVRDLQQVLQNIDSKAEAVVDARGAARFDGTAPEPRKGVRGGHIPGSTNVPFDSVLENGRFKDASALKEVFQNAGVDWRRPIVTSCGTGVTASVLAFALHLIDPQQAVAVYDGSWTEWGGKDDTPVATN